MGVEVEALAGTLAIVVVLASVGEALTEFLVSKVWKKYGLDTFWLEYIGAGLTFALVLVSGQNLLSDYFPNSLAMHWMGRVLTALLAGRGATFIHDFFTAQRAKADQFRILTELRERSWGKRDKGQGVE